MFPEVDAVLAVSDCLGDDTDPAQGDVEHVMTASATTTLSRAGAVDPPTSSIVTVTVNGLPTWLVYV